MKPPEVSHAPYMPYAPQAFQPFLNTELFKIGTTSVNLVTLVTAVVIVLLSYVVSRGLRVGMRRFVARGGMAPTGELGASSAWCTTASC